MITIGDVLAYEYDSPQRLTLDDVAKAAIDSGLVNLFQEWHEENDQSNIDISIRYAGSLQTEIVVSVNDQEVVRDFGWHIQRAVATVLANLDSKTEEPMFAGVLLALLAEKNREAQLAAAQPAQPSALERLGEWVDAAGDGNERMYKIEAGRNWAGVLLYHNGAELLGCGEPTIDAAILAVLDAAAGGE